MSKSTWSVITGSVTGDSHLRNDVPNQDAVISLQLPGPEAGVILAVSDGHGSKSCFRSDIGSRIAVGTAVRVFSEMSEVHLLQNLVDGVSSQRKIAFERYVRKEVVKKVTEEWRRQVENHFQQHREELQLEGPKLWKVYGATLTIVFVSNRLLIACCLGDGSILVKNDRNVGQILSLEAAESIGEDTDSLCLEDAASRFRVYFEFLGEEGQPDLVLACTDGFSNAFKTSEGFEKAAKDFSHQLSSANGETEVKDNLEIWLREFSSFSGDDVTVGIVYRSKKPTDHKQADWSAAEDDADACGAEEEKAELDEDAPGDCGIKFLDADRSNETPSVDDEKKLESSIEATYAESNDAESAVKENSHGDAQNP